MAWKLEPEELRKLKEEIKREEGEVLKSYRDSLGKLTVGIGHLVVRGDPEYEKPVGAPISKARSTALFETDIQRTLNDLEKKLPWLKLQPKEVIRAVANMAFQLGVTGVLKFKNTLAYIEQKNYESAYVNGLRSLWAKQTPQRARRVLTMIRNAKVEEAK